ncbi:uncharacterized protein C5L36_0A01340 [Pichia kudriavzevii]|uniref:Uncharacterized protein n=1 Tax=Pichia kudriavzevii TaxID=4909 RepID=A0A2U9QX04_PICKU|nr:uncharacterized protein C5L36_0A01340 [Pichia kudriavzevii]AWU73528.1 hypothetical protein C5L36_0A01340 [Pichia kudriavzevii]
MQLYNHIRFIPIRNAQRNINCNNSIPCCGCPFFLSHNCQKGGNPPSYALHRRVDIDIDIDIFFPPPPQKPTLLHRRVASSSRFPKTVLKYKPYAAFLFFLFFFQKHHGKKNTSNDFWPTLDDLSVSRLLGSDNCFPFPFSFFPPPPTQSLTVEIPKEAILTRERVALPIVFFP